MYMIVLNYIYIYAQYISLYVYLMIESMITFYIQLDLPNQGYSILNNMYKLYEYK